MTGTSRGIFTVWGVPLWGVTELDPFRAERPLEKAFVLRIRLLFCGGASGRAEVTVRALCETCCMSPLETFLS